ncbi:MAG: ABC transporter ATP-binding protein [Thermomicrobiales bacterium]
MHLAVQHLSFHYGKRQILHDICLDGFTSGEVVAVIGPNAAGKSTLFRCIAGLLRGEGDVLLDGVMTRNLKRSEVSQRIAYMPQDNLTNARMTVFESMLLALQVNASWRVSDEDLDRVHRTLVGLGIDHLALRFLNELSGGQRQMVSIGQALVREPEAIILDEPTNNLDLQRQLELLDLVRSATRQRNLLSILALHDLNLAARVADRVLLLDQGRVCACGAPHEVITEETLATVFGVHARIETGDQGIPHIALLGSRRTQEWVL